MTQTIDHPTSWPDPNLDGIHILTQRSTDYLQRIHWWVRLFGIVWIVIPVVAFVAFLAFSVTTIVMSRVSSAPPPAASSFSKCLDEFSVSECNRWYPD